MLKYVFQRFGEASTWRGVVLVFTSIGITLSPEQVDALIALGLAASGVIGVFFPDSLK